jgi:hypothetical protein
MVFSLIAQHTCGDEHSILQVALDGRVLSGTIIAGCVSLAAVYGFNNPSPSLMTQRYVMPTASTTAAQAGAWREAPPLPGSKNGALPMYAEPGIFGNEKQALPSTVPSDESPVGMRHSGSTLACKFLFGCAMPILVKRCKAWSAHDTSLLC